MSLQSLFYLAAIIFILLWVLVLATGLALIIWVGFRARKLEREIRIKLEPVFKTAESIEKFTSKVPVGPLAAGAAALIPLVRKILKSRH